MADQNEFDLEFDLEPPPDTAEGYRDGRPIPPPPVKPTGRPKGSKNKLTRRDPLWKMAASWSPKILAKMCERAAAMETELDFRCGQLILSRTWAKPRSAPIQIDIAQIGDNPQTLLSAMQQGQITPADAATLYRALEAGNGGGRPNSVSAQDAREVLADRLARAIEARQIAAAKVEASTETERPGGDDEQLAELLGAMDEPAAADTDLANKELEEKFAELQRRWQR